MKKKKQDSTTDAQSVFYLFWKASDEVWVNGWPSISVCVY